MIIECNGTTTIIRENNETDNHVKIGIFIIQFFIDGRFVTVENMKIEKPYFELNLNDFRNLLDKLERIERKMVKIQPLTS